MLSFWNDLTQPLGLLSSSNFGRSNQHFLKDIYWMVFWLEFCWLIHGIHQLHISDGSDSDLTTFLQLICTVCSCCFILWIFHSILHPWINSFGGTTWTWQAYISSRSRSTLFSTCYIVEKWSFFHSNNFTLKDSPRSGQTVIKKCFPNLPSHRFSWENLLFFWYFEKVFILQFLSK